MAIGPRVLEIAFQSFQIWKFSGGMPLDARAFGASKFLLYH